MNGELDFAARLTERVALLEGVEETAIAEICAARLRLNPGARQLVSTMRAAGALTILVSGGFTLFTAFVARLAGFERHHGNRLEIADGRLTGRVLAPILGAQAKLETLDEAAAELGLDREAVLALGDGANDRPMLEAAGLAVAYRPHPVLVAAADLVLAHADLAPPSISRATRRPTGSRLQPGLNGSGGQLERDEAEIALPVDQQEDRVRPSSRASLTLASTSGGEPTSLWLTSTIRSPGRSASSSAALPGSTSMMTTPRTSWPTAEAGPHLVVEGADGEAQLIDRQRRAGRRLVRRCRALGQGRVVRQLAERDLTVVSSPRRQSSTSTSRPTSVSATIRGSDAHLGDRLAVELEDDVARLMSGLLGRAGRRDAGDERAAAPRRGPGSRRSPSVTVWMRTPSQPRATRPIAPAGCR